MARRGVIVEGRFAVIPSAAAMVPGASARPDALYELRVKLDRTLSVAEAEEAADVLWSGVRTGDVALLGVDVSGNVARLQVTGVSSLSSPPQVAAQSALFPWEPLVSSITTVLAAITILVIAITFMMMVGATPGWTWSVVVLAGLAFIIYSASKKAG